MPCSSPTTSAPPSGRRASSFRRPCRDARYADGGRAAQQRGQQVAARRDRVLERDALARQQQRAVEVLLDERLRPEAPRVGGARLVARLAALLEEERAGARGERQQREHGAQQRAQAPVRAPGAPRLGLALPRGWRRGTRARRR